ncbi:hypothetical protein [Paracoccus tibetensis]|uniref:Uncharacterized protein n=1 Tax=Paracoccus tibetensis TaxID=336292 RepID=A0A1G5HC69_9RHOB|nr:hypothetical protein [Paracoccus tibetensis]SCY61353.1 hypothetical protein SAMN05660710_02099 [Paracoccus tibetensis]
MAFLRTTVTGSIALPDGSPMPDGAKIIFTLREWDKNADTIATPGAVEAVVANSAISVQLLRTASTDRGTVYDVGYAYWSPGMGKPLTGRLGTIAISGSSAVNLAELLTVPAQVPNVPDALVQALAAAAGAMSAAARAEQMVVNADQVTADRQAAEAARDQAFLARDGAAVNADIYPDIATGRAAVADGAQFMVVSGDAIIRYRRDSASTQTEVARFPAASALLNEVQTRSAMLRQAGVEGVLLFATDAAGTRLAFGLRDSDGLFDDLTMAGIYARMAEERQLPTLDSTSQNLLELRATNGDLLWGTVRLSDGQWPDWAVEQLAERLGVSAGSAASAAPAYHLHNGVYRPVEADTRVVTGLGSSTIAFLAPHLAGLFDRLVTQDGRGVSYNNRGAGGERSDNHAARWGVKPALLTSAIGVIPASGSVNVTASNMAANSLLAYAGTWGGVPGTLRLSGGSLNFQRASSGSEVAVAADTPFIPTGLDPLLGGVLILNTGKNDISGQVPAATIISNIDAICDGLTAANKRFLILDNYGDTPWIASNPRHALLRTVNEHIHRRYGDLVIRNQAYLCGAQIWADANADSPGFGAPTPEDVAMAELGNIPPSFARDTGHMSEFANQLLVKHVIESALKSLHWYKDA